MTYTVTVPYHDDLYEVTVSGHLIKRIVKYHKDSQFRCGEFTLESLPEDARDKILQFLHDE